MCQALTRGFRAIARLVDQAQFVGYRTEGDLLFAYKTVLLRSSLRTSKMGRVLGEPPSSPSRLPSFLLIPVG
jgi:hypothetical protein